MSEFTINGVTIRSPNSQIEYNAQRIEKLQETVDPLVPKVSQIDTDLADLGTQVQDLTADVQINTVQIDAVRNIAQGKVKAYVVDTPADVASITGMVTGDPCYIRQLDTPDKWYDGRQWLDLETEKPALPKLYEHYFQMLGTYVDVTNGLNYSVLHSIKYLSQTQVQFTMETFQEQLSRTPQALHGTCKGSNNAAESTMAYVSYPSPDVGPSDAQISIIGLENYIFNIKIPATIAEKDPDNYLQVSYIGDYTIKQLQ